MSKISFRPIGDQILVKPDDPETKTKSGIILTEDSAEKPKSGTVVKLGTYENMPAPDNNNKPFKFTVKVGSRVYWSGYGGNEIEIDGVKYLVIRENQLLGFDEE